MKKHKLERNWRRQAIWITTAGGCRICQILRVEDKEDKEYLSIEFDIAEGLVHRPLRESG